MKTALTFLLCTLLSCPAWAFTLCLEDADYLPYMIGTGDAKGNGMLVEMLRMAAKQNQQELKIVTYPWKRCIDMLGKGQVDALGTIIWLPERDKWAAYPKLPGQLQGAPDRSKRIWTAEYPVFIPKDSALRFDGMSFTGVKTGLSAPPGYIAWQRLKDAGVLNEAVLLPKAGLNLVALNRLDGYIVERNIGQHLLRSIGQQQQVTTLPQPFLKDDWYLVFSHAFQTANPELTERLWSSLAKIREEHGQSLLSTFVQQDSPAAQADLPP